jgi:hypothetical protein
MEVTCKIDGVSIGSKIARGDVMKSENGATFIFLGRQFGAHELRELRFAALVSPSLSCTELYLIPHFSFDSESRRRIHQTSILKKLALSLCSSADARSSEPERDTSRTTKWLIQEENPQHSSVR